MAEQKYVLHSPEGQIETIYLAVYPDKILLLDWGCLCDVRRIRTYIRKVLGRRMEDVKLAFVSHIHPDHSGAAPVPRRRYMTPIAAHRSIDTWYKGLSGWVQHLIDYIFSWAVIIRMGRHFQSLMPGTAKRPPWTFRLVMPLMLLPPDIRKSWREAPYDEH